MRVLVAALEPGCTAHLALQAEGVEHEERVCKGDTGYAALLAEAWRAGRGFVVVEHDVAPWMGAVAQLVGCGRDWCMFRYPKYGGALTRGLGCAKFSDRLIHDYPDLSDAWQDTDWRVLDGAVGGAVAEVLRAEVDRFPLCFHGPPVAHARRAD